MKCLDRSGHRYELDNLEINSGGERDQVIQFIHKESEPYIGVGGSRKLVTVLNGTTNEEVLAVLIDRLRYLQAKTACRENAIVITKLEESLMWLNKRTEDRKARSVEGTSAT
jgi:hypothetical protein